MSKINSRQKGARGERLVRDIFIAHGYPARRGQQFAGGTDSPDVIIPDLEWLHVESKFVENLDLNKALEQSERDAEGKFAIVMHKKKNKDWLVTMSVESFFELLTKAHDEQQKRNCNSQHTDVSESAPRPCQCGNSG